MLEIIVADEFVDVVFNLPSDCIDKVVKNIICSEAISNEKAAHNENVFLTKLYNKVNGL